jgi:hypothetical protein
LLCIQYEYNLLIFLSTSKGITGLNFPNLNGVIQYGTTYNPENTLQLFARLRDNGNVTIFKIKDMINQNKRDKTIELKRVFFFILIIFNELSDEQSSIIISSMFS